ncbi:MAG: DsbA family protein [Alphaproteobacteria bacterium]|nr:DsbA family protein [Alphaproteobacteria bacterium]
MTRLVKSVLICLTLAFGGQSVATLPAAADIGDADREALNKMFEDYIRANPEVVREALLALAKREADAALTVGLRTLHDDAGDPFIGNPDARIVIYEFSDYNCGYCKRVFGPLQQLLAEDDDVKLVLKEFPILSQTSMLAAQAAVAAQAQGVFPDFHVAMMTARGAVSMESIMAAAGEAGADLDRLQADMNGAEVAMIIERTRAAAQQLNISGTPGLVIGTQVIPGAIGIDELRQIVAAMRAENG